MPGGDRTGPMGQGPLSGRGLGACGGYQSPGYFRPRLGRGFRRGMGRGFGRGFGRGQGYGWGYMPQVYGPPADPYYTQPFSQEEEHQALSQEADYLKEQIKQIESRLKELEGQKKNK